MKFTYLHDNQKVSSTNETGFLFHAQG